MSEHRLQGFTSVTVALAAVFVLTFSAAAVGGLASARAGSFYESLERPSWAPSTDHPRFPARSHVPYAERSETVLAMRTGYASVADGQFPNHGTLGADESQRSHSGLDR